MGRICVANAAALIQEGLWRDRDFRNVPRLPQCTYQQVLAQKDLDCAGVLTLNLPVLAKGCAELTVEQLRADFAVLEAARFVFVDEDTDEILVRSYMRLVSVKSPNAWKSAFKAARLIQSDKLRRALASELRRMRRADATGLAEELDPIRNPSESLPEPIRNPSGGDIPSGTHPEPPSSVLGRYLTLSSTQVGEAPPVCRKHDENSTTPCHACKQRREWDQAQEAEQAAGELAARRAERDRAQSCRICQGTNWIPDTDPAVRCTHQEMAHA